MIQPDAKHVVCAYNISQRMSDVQEENQENELCYLMDYHDDGEPAAGRMLLDLLCEHNIREKAVFVARIYGGNRIGTDRFKCYLRAAKIALDIQVLDPAQPEPKPAPAFVRAATSFRKQSSSAGFRGRGRAGGGKNTANSQKYAAGSQRGRGYQRSQPSRPTYSNAVRGARPPTTQRTRYNHYYTDYNKYGTNPDFRSRLDEYQYNFSEPWEVPNYQHK